MFLGGRFVNISSTLLLALTTILFVGTSDFLRRRTITVCEDEVVDEEEGGGKGEVEEGWRGREVGGVGGDVIDVWTIEDMLGVWESVYMCICVYVCVYVCVCVFVQLLCF